MYLFFWFWNGIVFSVGQSESKSTCGHGMGWHGVDKEGVRGDVEGVNILYFVGE